MKPSEIIKAKVEELESIITIPPTPLSDNQYKAILWYLNQEYFKKPTNDPIDYEI